MTFLACLERTEEVRRCGGGHLVTSHTQVHKRHSTHCNSGRTEKGEEGETDEGVDGDGLRTEILVRRYTHGPVRCDGRSWSFRRHVTGGEEFITFRGYLYTYLKCLNTACEHSV